MYMYSVHVCHVADMLLNILTSSSKDQQFPVDRGGCVKVSLWHFEPSAGQLTPNGRLHIESQDITAELDVLKILHMYRYSVGLVVSKGDNVRVLERGWDDI